MSMAGSCWKISISLVAFPVLALLFSGCSTVPLRVITDPPTAIVTIRKDNGAVVATKVSPAQAQLSFRNQSEACLIEAVPSPSDQDRYLPMKNHYTQAEIEALPTVDKNFHLLKLALAEKEFINLTYLEVVLDPVLGWRGLVTQRRAYQNITEQGGRAPQLVVEFKERLAVRGMAISPNGQRIVYSVATARDLPDFGAALRSGDKQLVRLEQSNVRAVNLQGGGIEQVTQENFLDLDPSFSPDGRFLLMASNRRRPAQTDILRISSTARTGGIQDLYVDNRNSTICKPGQAVNGLIAFNLFPSGWQDLREAQIWTVGGPDGYPTQVALGTQPALSPDGKRIAFIQAGNLWVCNADGSGATQLTTDAAEISAAYEATLSPMEREVFQYERTRFFSPYSYPSWSPDGKFLAYTSMKSTDPTGRPNEDIWVMSIDGTQREQLTTNFSADRCPMVSPDGKSIYFLSNRGKQWAIWRIPTPAIMNGGQ